MRKLTIAVAALVVIVVCLVIGVIYADIAQGQVPQPPNPFDQPLTVERSVHLTSATARWTPNTGAEYQGFFVVAKLFAHERDPHGYGVRIDTFRYIDWPLGGTVNKLIITQLDPTRGYLYGVISTSRDVDGNWVWSDWEIVEDEFTGTSPTPTPMPTVTLGLTIAPENRCSTYNSNDYSYPASVEPRIVENMGGRIYGPYTGTYFNSITETDIEHIVARSEAHDSGMCARSVEDRKQFARDLLNLTLAAPSVNRHQKRAKDAAEWLPERNKCWFADTVVKVRKKWKLTTDQREADALDAVLDRCTDVGMIFFAQE